mmetsp:Transcript_42216/g.117541  ORF Transcript_42216/g.117541 Transcript_42216/m.117541 type:complete len:85 (+) Transcript_42216:304-558(+)
MPKVLPPELKKYMEKRLSIKLNAARRVTGVLRGYDQFMNLVLDEAIENPAGSTSASAGEGAPIGLVVVRGNSIVQMECLDYIKG